MELFRGPWAGRRNRMTASSEAWVLLARVVRPQGRQGEVLADIFTDFPEHFTRRKRLFLVRQAAVPILCRKLR